MSGVSLTFGSASYRNIFMNVVSMGEERFGWIIMVPEEDS